LKEFWFRIEESLPLEKKREILKKTASVCDVIFVSDRDFALARDMSVKKVAGPSKGDIQILSNFDPDRIRTLRHQQEHVGMEITVRSGKDEEVAGAAAEAGAEYVLISCPNWKVIPLENLIARVHGKSKLIAEVSDVEEARTALKTLELGSDGILLKTVNLGTIDEVANIIRSSDNVVRLIEAKITNIKALGNGARVCVDTTELMKQGEGMLVGCQSSGLFLAQAEVEVNPHVETRPFRVNAGPVSCYVLTPGNKTKYLSDLRTGDEVLIVDRSGKTRVGNVGRVKIESRPMILIEAEAESLRIKTVTQNAETIRLVTPTGSVSVSELKVGDTVLARLEEGGRHFGALVRDEMVIER
jgi:3-dehydroquinate synthase II